MIVCEDCEDLDRSGYFFCCLYHHGGSRYARAALSIRNAKLTGQTNSPSSDSDHHRQHLCQTLLSIFGSREECRKMLRLFLISAASTAMASPATMPFATKAARHGNQLNQSWQVALLRVLVDWHAGHKGEHKALIDTSLRIRLWIRAPQGYECQKGQVVANKWVPLVTRFVQPHRPHRSRGNKRVVFLKGGLGECTLQGAHKGTNLRGQTDHKRRFSQIFADFCRFSLFPRKQSIWETQIFAENR